MILACDTPTYQGYYVCQIILKSVHPLDPCKHTCGWTHEQTPNSNKRAQRALGRSPEEKVKGHSVANNREPQGHNLNNFGRGPFDDVIY